MTIKNKFDLKEIVYLTSDPEQHRRVVTSIFISGDGGITYMLNCGAEQSEHYDFEISRERELQL